MIIITGINGFIAQHLYNKLKNITNHEIIGTTKYDSINITEILNKHNPEYIYHIGAEITAPR